MSEQQEEDKKRRPTKRQFIPVEGTALAFAIFAVANDQVASDRFAKLALRGPDFVRLAAHAVLAAQGKDIDQLMSGEPDSPATEAEVMEFAAPVLKYGAALAGITQLLSIYLLDESSTPEEIIYALYILIRLAVVGEREPSSEQRRQIWTTVLTYARHAKIVAPRWQELESQGQVYLDDWLEETKEKARKKFKTFLYRKQRIEVNAEGAFKYLMSILFSNGYGESAR